MPFKGDWDKLEDPSGPPGENLTCPGCNTTYEWEWTEDTEGWWPGNAEWWYTDRHDFVCHYQCWKAVQGAI